MKKTIYNKKEKRSYRIKNNVKNCPTIEFEKCIIIQGNLKSNIDLEKLQNSLVSRGIIFPFFIWKNDDGQFAIIDGSRRTQVLRSMQEGGYKIDAIPYVPIQAETIEEAKIKILRASSKYSSIYQHGYNAFVRDLNQKRLKYELSSLDYGFIYKEDKKVGKKNLIEAKVGKGNNPRVEFEKRVFNLNFKNSKECSKFYEQLEEIGLALYPDEINKSVIFFNLYADFAGEIK